MCYYDYDDYCEPSEEKQFFEDLKDKFKAILNKDIKAQLDSLQTENQELKDQLAKYKEAEKELREKERKYNWAVNDLKKKVENDFYNRTVVDVLEKIMETSEVWYAEDTPHSRPKCNLCNDKRELVAEFPNGKVRTIKCDCATMDYFYEPVLFTNKSVEFHKSFKEKYYSERKMYFKTKYCNDKTSEEAYSHYCVFKIEEIYDEFNDDVKDYHNKKRYDENIAFRNKEACQQYCDWLNNKDKKMEEQT